MKSRFSLSIFLLVLLPALPGQAQGPEVQSALTTAFTYQGQLRQAGSPFSGTCDFQFSLWDDSASGTQIGATQTRGNVSVARGLFTVQVDFGAGVFRGDARWLGIKVRCPAGSGTYTALSPRQALTAAPYALALPGLWTEMNATSPNVIGGYSRNTVTAGAYGATISGGGANGSTNLVTDIYGTVGGGANNRAGDGAAITSNAPYATVGGGNGNISSGVWAAVCGGESNTASGTGATVAGGQYNIASGYAATVPGGSDNRAFGDYSFAAGQNARANYKGSFVWADSTDALFASTANDQFAVRAAGGVRIVQGANSFVATASALQVEKASGGEAAWFYLTSAANNNPVMKLLKASTASDFLAGVYKNGASETQKFHIDANGAYHAGADFAESLPAAGGKAGYEPGDVLVISAEDAGAVEKSSKPCDTAVIGVYSTEPGFVGGVVQGPEDIPVAILGIVPVKASAENGAIAPGDLLTTSATPGHSMKASPITLNGVTFYPSGVLIGKAMEGLDTGTGVIRMLVSLQ